MTIDDLAPYRGARVLVTGHTGFKGSWLCETLLLAGAEVHGYALRPPTRPALFTQLGLARRLASHTTGDVRDAALLANAVRRIDPDFVFHLAAQPLVRESYRRPAETFDANVMGTVNLLEALRTAPRRNRPGRERSSASRPTSATRTTTRAIPSARTTRSAAPTPTARRRGHAKSRSPPTAAASSLRRSRPSGSRARAPGT